MRDIGSTSTEGSAASFVCLKGMALQINVQWGLQILSLCMKKDSKYGKAHGQYQV